MTYKQIIQLPDRVSQSVFGLPCVHAIYKGLTGIEYTLFIDKFEGVTMTSAKPGDNICENDEGKWILKRKKMSVTTIKFKTAENADFDMTDLVIEKLIKKIKELWDF